MKWIHLSKEYYTCVNDKDFELVKNPLWRYSDKCYARARLPCGKDVFLHCFLVSKKSSDLEIDHVNRCPWDNRRKNLKVVPRWKNQQNKGIPTECPLPTESEKTWAKEFRKKLKATSLRERGMSKPRGKSVARPVRDENGKIYENCAHAARSLGATGGANIAQAAQGNRKTAYGLRWEYV